MSKKIFTLKTKDETTVEVARFGNSKPNILLISGMHGDEKTGSQVLELLINDLDSQSIQGTVDIIKIANPKAYQANRRLHPNDSKDLNRSFPPSGNNTPTDNLAGVLGEFAISHDLVVDLHTFPNQISPLIGVLLSNGHKDKQKESNELLKIIQPDVIWFLDAQKTEPKKGGSICSLALKNNIAAFGLELPPDDLVSQDQITMAAEGLLAVLGKLNVIDYEKSTKTVRQTPIYERDVYKSLDDGQFIPQKDIMTKVNKDEIIGKITNQQTGQIKEIISPTDGILLTISKERIIKKVEKLFVLAKEFLGHLN